MNFKEALKERRRRRSRAAVTLRGEAVPLYEGALTESAWSPPQVPQFGGWDD